MPTSNQLRLIHVAARKAGLDDARYRVLLSNVGGVSSSKDLDQSGFEDVMATLEDLGFRETGVSEDYWRRRVTLRGSQCGPRVVHLLRQLAEGGRYSLDALCLRFSDGRTDRPEKLSPREGHNLVEMLKASGAREGSKGD